MLRLLAAGPLLALALAVAADPPTPAAQLLGTDGKPAPLASVRGKAATALVFVSGECPVSNDYLTTLADLNKQYAEKGVAVLAVCPTDDPPAAVGKWAAEYKVAVPVYLDPKREVAAAVGAKTTPEAAVLDAAGKVCYRGRIDDAYSARLKKNPAVTSHDLRNALDDLLAGKPVRTPATVAVGCPIDFDTGPAPSKGEVTYHKHVAPIIQKHCQGCHRPGEVGPFALTNYKQARRWAADIVTFTKSRQMPPWMPAGGVTMKGERKLTAAEIDTLARWESAGTPEGDPKDAPPPVQYPDGWRLGKPDLVLTPSADFHLGASGTDIFRCFVIPTQLTEDKWVIGYDVKPGNPRIVHHTQHFFDTSGTAREMERKHQLKEASSDTADRGPGYPTSMGVGFVAGRDAKGQVPRVGSLGGWVPGQNLDFLPAGTGWRLPKGSDFVLFTHFHRDGKPSAERTRVGLYFAKGPVEQPWQMVVINGMRPWERIPAGQADYVARGAVYLHADAILHGVMPHMHLLGRTVKVTMTPPGGKPVALLDIPAWDYRWQEGYLFREPLPAKVGTKLEVEVVFDNSAANPNNPHRPPQDVTFGEQTTDEMLYTFIGATSPKTPSERVQTYPYPPAGGPGVPGGTLTPVLEQRVGTWDTKLTLKFGIAPPLTFTGKDVVEKGPGGAYIRGQATPDAGGMRIITQATYDAERKAYRMWLYDTQGTTIELTGTYDEAAKVLTWAAVPQGGMEAAVVWKFLSADKAEWSGKVTSAGRTVLEVSATMDRKK